MGKLTFKQIKFVEAYAGNGKEAAITAGYTPTHADKQANKLLKMPEVIEAIRAEGAYASHLRIATRQQRQAFWTTVMDDPSEKMLIRLKASELLGRSFGDFVERHELQIPATIIRLPLKKAIGDPVSGNA